jgi:hypothetical protein
MFGSLKKALKGNTFMSDGCVQEAVVLCLGSSPRNSRQAGYASLCINGSHVKILVMIFSDCCNNFARQHPQTGFSCTCPIDMSSVVTRYFIAIQNFSPSMIMIAHLSKHVTTVVL